MKSTILLLILVLGGCATATDRELRPPLASVVRVNGTSMGQPGNLRQVYADFGFPFSQLEKGDTVIYWDWQRHCYVHHRLVHQIPFIGWVTQGDANSLRDDCFVTYKNFIARTLVTF